MTVLRGSGSNRRKWWRTRPPAAIPLAETMIDELCIWAIAFDASTDLAA